MTSDGLFPEAVKMRLRGSLLLENGLLHEAFHRHHSLSIRSAYS